MDNDRIDGVFEHYKGKKRFVVRHESLGECRVAAPDQDSAIVAAADHFGQDWTRIAFYAYCTVTKDYK